MSRELIEQVIEIKKTLNEELEKAQLEYAALEKKLPYSIGQKEAELQELHRRANEKKAAIKAKLDRAETFGRRFCKGVAPSICITCFIDHDLSSEMVEIESRLGRGRSANGIRTFKCKKPCGYELSVDEAIPQPGGG